MGRGCILLNSLPWCQSLWTSLWSLSCLILKTTLMKKVVLDHALFINKYYDIQRQRNCAIPTAVGAMNRIFFVRAERMAPPRVVVFQSLGHVQPFVIPWTAALQASPSFTISQSLLKLMPIEPVMPSNHLILCRPLLLLPSIFPSISLFQWVGSPHQVAKVLELQLQHQFFQWIFRTDFF